MKNQSTNLNFLSEFSGKDHVYFDIASRYIDNLGTLMGFPHDEFFSDDQFGERVGPIFIRAEMDMQQANSYLSEITPIINKLVNDRILKKK